MKVRGRGGNAFQPWLKGSGVLRVHFSAEDLIRTRVGTTYGPLAETVFALDAMQRRSIGPALQGWREEAGRGVDGWTRQLAELLPRASAFDVIGIAGRAPDIERGLDAFHAAPLDVVRSELDFSAEHCGSRHPVWAASLLDRSSRGRAWFVDALRRQHAATVEPYWARIEAALRAEHARLLRLLEEGGVERLLESLHPAIRWRIPTLTVPSTRPRLEVTLDGRGLTIVPSLFCPLGHPVCSVENTRHEDIPYVLFYPVPLGIQGSQALQLASSETEEALAALLGRSRAKVLMVIGVDGPCTTTELARRCGLSASSASQHATVLRKAGLITTVRDGNVVRHTLTPLGGALLDS